MIAWLWGILKLIFEILLFAAVFHSLTSHFMVWLEFRNKQLQDQIHIEIPWPNLIKNCVMEAGFTLLYLLMLPFAKWIGAKRILNSHAQTPPLLLIHGYLHNRNDWLWFQHHLQCIEGIGSIFTINLQPTQNIADSALAIEKKVTKIKKITGQDKVILMGHSRGGLVASYYAEYLATENSVASVISVGSPFSGTKLAAFGVTENVKELALNAPLLTALKERIQHSQIPHYQVASKIDNMIVPWNSACPWQFRTPQNTLILDNMGHLGLLHSSRVLTQVVDWIFKIPLKN